jgi:3-oxoacyl-[acyl-carrier-protein] synthase II
MLRVVELTGVGALTPLGGNLAAMWPLVVGDETPFVAGGDPEVLGGPPRLRAAVADEDLAAALPSRRFRRLPRQARMVVGAGARCFEDAGIARPSRSFDPDRIGIFLGTGRGPIEAVENLSLDLVEGRRQVNPHDFQESVYNAPLGHLSIHFKITGPCVALSNGVVSGLQAIEMALQGLASGRLDLALVGGVDSLTDRYVRGMADCRILSGGRRGRERMAPFCAERDGVVLGEGALFLALEVPGCRRGAPPPRRYLRVEAASIASEGSLHYANDPDGAGFEAALGSCLAEGGITPDGVDLVLAAATGQRQLDRAEARALARIWADAGSRPALTSVKGIFGDLGAGAQLAALALASEVFERDLLPATRPRPRPDPQCPVRPLVDLVERRIETAVIQEAAWGGQNAAVLVRRIDEEPP